jgi:hypothetical protein
MVMIDGSEEKQNTFFQKVRRVLGFRISRGNKDRVSFR